MLDLFRPPAAELVLRDYQAEAIEALRDGVRNGLRRQVLVAGTGAGKTVCATHLQREADRKGSDALFLVDRVSLVDQTSTTLDRYGIDHGVVQATHPRWSPESNVQVCSIQTLARRRLPRVPDLVCWDECHIRSKAMADYLDSLPGCVRVGLTATPFTRGMGNDWDRAVNVIPTMRLIDGGHLVLPKIYVAKSPDEADLGLNSYGEFSDAGATAAGIQIVGDVVQEWQTKVHEHFGGPVKTIVFAATVEHGREICAAFAAAGHNFQQISYMDKDDAERREKIEEFRKPDSLITGLVSCGVLQRGFDVTDVQCGISCRPYRKSLSSHMQEIGRIMRPHGENKRAIWLDHSGNIERFGRDMWDVWENGAGALDHASTLDSKPRERERVERERPVCPECSGALRGNICLCCGWEKPARSSVVNVDGQLHEFDPQQAFMEARAGLRAECLKDPKLVWMAALCFCGQGNVSDEAMRKRAYAIWRGIYPNGRLGSGWWHLPPVSADPNAWSLIEREVKRFRKQRRAA